MNSMQILSFLLPTLALNFTPGPDMLFVIGRSLKGGPMAAAKAVAGLWLGGLFHVALVCLGIAALLAKVPEAFIALKILGSSYLVLLGARLLLKAGKGPKAVAKPAEGGFFDGVLVAALNPKTAVFFLAFLPQFVRPGESSPALQMLALGLVFGLSSTLVNFSVGSVAWFLSRRRQAARTSLPVEQACGLAMLGMAARLAFQ
jgi:threonine/homoserine/homoserine lactone efflux protein